MAGQHNSDRKTTDELIKEKHNQLNAAYGFYMACTRKRILTEEALKGDKLESCERRILENALSREKACEKDAEDKLKLLERLYLKCKAVKAEYDANVERMRLGMLGRVREAHEKRRARDREEEQSAREMDWRAKQQAEEKARQAEWKAKYESGAPATIMIESDERPLRRPTISFVMEAGECLNFGATCPPCKMHTYFWFKQVHGNEAAAKRVDLAKGAWTPTYTFDKSYVKCGKCQTNLAH